MRVLYLDCGMGAAGDMLQSALISLLSEEQQNAFIDEINNIGIKGIVEELADDVKCGITCKHVSVRVNGQEEISEDVVEKHEHEHHHDQEHHHDHDHVHHHDHEHHDHGHEEHHHEHGHHHHASMDEIVHNICHLNISEKVKENVISVYEMIAQAEAKVHGKSVSEVHFHEVGMMDALADITGVSLLLEKLNVDKIICSPINVGYGKVKCAHGILPVPAPATSEIIKGIPVYAGRFEGEMCTPTGAALLKYFTDEFSTMPVMKIEKTGYGSGNKDFDAANVIRAVVGELVDASVAMNRESEKKDNYSDRIVEIKCNIDDITGEDLAYAVDTLMRNGARDAFVTQIMMKKGRSGYLLTVLCSEEDREKIVDIIFKSTSTIGIRECVMDRRILNRRMDNIATEFGDVSVKISEGYGVKRIKAEFDDIKEIAEKNEIPISKVRAIIGDILNRIEE